MPLKDPEKRRAYHAKYMREHWYPANREKHIGMVAISRARNRDDVREKFKQLKSAPCLDCGGSFPPEAMDFDHVRGKKQFDIGPSAGRKSWSQIEAEILKCEVVCSNCHRIRTMARRRGRAVGSPSSS